MRACLDGLALGDQTARLEGRVTLNPMYHVDPVGTLLFPALIIFGPFIGFSFFSGILIGWAKPTPVITRNFRKIRPRRQPGHAGRPGFESAAGFCWRWSCCWSLPCIAVSAIPNGREIVHLTFQGRSDPRRATPTMQAVVLLARGWRSRSISRSSSSTCCRFRRSMAATCCAICCPTTPCRPTTAFPSG